MSKFTSPDHPETPESAEPVPPAPLIPVADLAQAFAEALAKVQAQQTIDTKELIQAARARRPESYNGDFPFPNRSVRNPDGDERPVPPLKCKMWDGVWDAKENKANEGHPLDQEQLTKREVRLLNQLEAGVFTLENRDGSKGIVRVYVERDTNERPMLLIIAYPLEWVGKDADFNGKPSVTDACRQILGIEGNVDHWLDQREAESTAVA